MKIKLTLCVILAGIFTAEAGTLYVDNDLSRPAPYRTLAEAVAAASDGDTIILHGSGLAYDGTHIGKRLTIRGNGFGGDATPNLLGNPPLATIGNTKLTIGGWTTHAERASANGTVIEGIVLASTPELNSSNCIVRRCLSSFGFSVRGPANQFEGCIFSFPSDTANCFWTNTPITIDGNDVAVTGINVRNCIFTQNVSADPRVGSSDFHYCVFRRNVGATAVANDLRLKNTRFYNCIFGNFQILGDGPAGFRDENPLLMQNCLFLDGTPVMGNGIGTITDTYTNTFLGQGQWGEPYRIKPGAAALTASTTGGEIGAYGGPTPFKVGGYPAIPRILRTELLSADPTTGIRIKVEAESRD